MLRAAAARQSYSDWEPFFLRSAHRFFISMDSRFLPAGVIPPLFFFDGIALEARARVFRTVFVAPSPVNAAIALEILCASSFRSAIKDPTSIVSPLRLQGLPSRALQAVYKYIVSSKLL